MGLKLSFTNFLGGLWLPENVDVVVPPNGLVEAENIEYLGTGGVRGRRGRAKYNAAAVPGAIISAWRHYPRTGSPTLIIAVDVGATVDFYQGNDGAGTFATFTTSTGFADAKRWYFTNWASKNKTYLTNDTNGLKFYDGTQIAAVVADGGNQVALTALGPYLAVHKSRLYATKNDELNFSVYASEVNFDGKFLSVNQLSLNEPQGGTITGISSYQGILLGFKTTSLWRFLGDIGSPQELARYSDRGCLAPDTIALTPYGVIFLDRDGLFLTDGIDASPTELSRPIRSEFIGRTADTGYGAAVGVWHPLKQSYHLKLRLTDTFEYVLQRIPVLGGRPGASLWAWAKHTARPYQAGIAWASAGDTGQLTVGDADGFVHYLNTGTTDAGAQYRVRVRTTSRLISNDLLMGRAYHVKALYRAAGVLTGALHYNNAQMADESFTV
jgi:hypothetical protein